MGADPVTVTQADSAVEPTLGQRLRRARFVVLAIVVIVAVAAVTTILTAPRLGGRMDPTSTSPDGARALVTLLRDHGVDVIEAPDIEAVERAAGPDTLTVVVQTRHLYDQQVLDRLARLPGDRLLVEPTSRVREKLAPTIRPADVILFSDSDPDCDLREANRAGTVYFGSSQAYEGVDATPVTRCYGGALVRYLDDGGREVTVVGTSGFMTNEGLLDEGNAALAMNLAGTQPRMIWYAPQFSEGDSGGTASVTDLIPDRVNWVVWQLVLAVVLLALWQGRRLGPLVAEPLPVVVRASETVEGRGRLYRARRARDRAADALRTAALQRMLPRLGLPPDAAPPAIVQVVASHSAVDQQAVGHILFGPPPSTDEDLVNLARELDNLERQVAQS